MGLLGRDTESGQSPSLTTGTRKAGTSRLDLSSAAFSHSLAAPGSTQETFGPQPSLTGAGAPVAPEPEGRWGGRAGDKLRDLERSRGGNRLSALVARPGLKTGK